MVLINNLWKHDTRFFFFNLILFLFFFGHMQNYLQHFNVFLFTKEAAVGIQLGTQELLETITNASIALLSPYQYKVFNFSTFFNEPYPF